MWPHYEFRFRLYMPVGLRYLRVLERTVVALIYPGVSP